MAESDPERTDFERAGDDEQPGLLAELWLFLKQEKKWWLVPLILVFLLVGLLLIVAGSAGGPFIYTFF